MVFWNIVTLETARRGIMEPDPRLPDKHRERTWEVYGKSVPQLFLDRVAARPDRVAFRYKDFGLYQEVTWRKYHDEVEAFALGLITLGVEPGDRIAIMGDPCFEYFIADLAGLAVGAITYGIYTTCSVAEVRHQLENGAAKVFIAENQEYVDKVLELRDLSADLQHIIVADMRAMFLYRDDRILSFTAAQERGRALAKKDPELFRRRALGVKPDNIAVLVYTSGTTGPPKAAMITNRDLMVGMVNTYLQGFPELEHGEHRTVTHLPLAHLVERSMSLCLMMIADVVPHIGEEAENLRETLIEVEPSFFHAVPRVWEKIASQILVNIDRSTPLKRLAYRLAFRVGRRHAQCLWRRRRPPPVLAAGYALARALVFRPMLMKVGLHRTAAALTAGAPIPQPVQAQWQIWGVNLRNLYGITEHTLVLCQSEPFQEPGDAGVPLYPKEVRLAPDGEILVSGPGMFAGYWRNEEATAAVVRDGWFHTGDVAEMTPSGHFRIIDRKKDIMVTAGGKNIAPSEIENLLKSSPFISEAVLFADGRKFPSALIEIDFDTVADWARQNGVAYTGFTSLALDPRVVGLIAREIENANAQLARVEQIKKFRVIPKELDPEEGDTTPTRKVKRRHIYNLFEDLVEDMYRDDTTARFELETSNLKTSNKDQPEIRVSLSMGGTT
jgi:long-chain acyl-CoA synthetase